jgi:hypothetical protein
MQRLDSARAIFAQVFQPEVGVSPPDYCDDNSMEIDLCVQKRSAESRIEILNKPAII